MIKDFEDSCFSTIDRLYGCRLSIVLAGRYSAVHERALGSKVLLRV